MGQSSRRTYNRDRPTNQNERQSMRHFVMLLAGAAVLLPSNLVPTGARAVWGQLAGQTEARLANDDATSAPLQLHGATRLEFATPEQGIAVVTARDRFVKSMSRFDRQARLMTGDEVGEEDYLRFVGQQVRDWKPPEIEKLSRVLATIRSKLEAFEVPFPELIRLVKTTGVEEAGAAYCRENAVVLPQRIVDGAEAGLESLLIHELFHVLSSQNAPLRQQLYGVIGFQKCPDVPLPKALQDRKITNPDGPIIDAYIELNHEGQRIRAVPVLYAKSDYDGTAKGTFFAYLTFRLLIVEEDNGVWSPALLKGEPQLLEPRPDVTPSYFEQIGENTGYIIHPDEILADNFVHLVKGTTKLKTPAIVEGMRKFLEKPAIKER